MRAWRCRRSSVPSLRAAPTPRPEVPVAPGWIVPDWPAPRGVQAVCTTREGGVSSGPYASLNLGDHVGDDGAAVAQNRRVFAAALDVSPVFMRQVHGTHVAEL